MPLALHLNGMPGIGKSTLARLWAEDHSGTWLLDIDELRTWVSGWETDFSGTGAAARPVALAMLTAAARGGHDVVLPQLLADPAERDRFRTAAEAGGARWVEVVLDADPAETSRRLRGRSRDRRWLVVIGELIEADPEVMADYAARVQRLVEQTSSALVLDTTGLDTEDAYVLLKAAVYSAR